MSYESYENSEPYSGTATLDRKSPPFNLAAESAVLGAMMLDDSCIDDVADIVRPSDFFRDAHQILFRVITDLRDRSRPCDWITVEDALTESGELAKVGGSDFLHRIISGVPHSAHARFYAKIVADTAISRELISASTETIDLAYAGETPVEALVSGAEERIFAIGDSRSRHELTTAILATEAAIESIEHRRAGRAGLGLETGLIELDVLTGGFQPGQLVIIGARPSMGKTALALQIANHAMDSRVPSFFASLEMGRVEIGTRLVSLRSGVEGGKLRQPHFLSPKDIESIYGARQDMTGLAPIILDDSPTLTATQIAAQARRVKSRVGLGLIVIDYIQLVDSVATKDSRQEQISKISRRFKALARELDVPVIALSQLNRALEAREDRVPRMSDLRESGAIEQDADVIILLHRPEYYDPNDQPGVAEAIVAKNRNGETGKSRLTFAKRIMKFESFYPIVTENTEAF